MHNDCQKDQLSNRVTIGDCLAPNTDQNAYAQLSLKDADIAKRKSITLWENKLDFNVTFPPLISSSVGIRA